MTDFQPEYLGGAVARESAPAAYSRWDEIRCVLLWCVGFTGLALEPFWIGAVVDGLHVSPGLAGQFGALQLGCTALASLAVAHRIDVLSHRSLGLLGLAFTLSGNLMVSFMPSVESLLVSRILVGVGEGATLAVVHAAMAGRKNSDRLYAISYVALMAYAMILYLALPPFIPKMGVVVIFATHAAVCVPGFVIVFWLRRRSSANSLSGRAKAALGSHALAALAAATVFYGAEGALWAYVERFGTRVGLSTAQIGRVMSCALLLTIATSLAAYAIGTRFGRRLPIASGLIILSCMAILLANAHTPLEYILGVVLFQVVGIFVMIYITGLLAALDPAGRIVAAAPAARGIGNTAGPAIAGFVLGAFGYQTIGLVALAFYLTALTAFLLLMRRHPQRAS
jgi:predicted MFS family arabinose efflux permease